MKPADPGGAGGRAADAGGAGGRAADAGPAGGRAADAGVGRLLRWYPRAWRKRYGEEFLAMVEDSLDGRRPTWRLHASVAWSGLRERGQRARLAGQRARLAGQRAARPALRALNSRWWTFLLAGFIVALLPYNFRASPSPARAWRVMAARDAVVAVAILGAVTVLAGGVIALPAFGKFLRAGGRPKIRRQVSWAAGATATATGGLVALVLVPGTHDQLNVSWTYSLGIAVTALLFAVMLGLWTRAALATGRDLGLSAEVRAAEKVLAVVITAEVSGLVYINTLWISAIESSASWLLVGVAGLVALAVGTPLRLRLAIRRGRRLRTAAARQR